MSTLLDYDDIEGSNIRHIIPVFDPALGTYVLKANNTANRGYFRYANSTLQPLIRYNRQSIKYRIDSGDFVADNQGEFALLSKIYNVDGTYYGEGVKVYFVIQPGGNDCTLIITHITINLTTFATTEYESDQYTFVDMSPDTWLEFEVAFDGDADMLTYSIETSDGVEKSSFWDLSNEQYTNTGLCGMYFYCNPDVDTIDFSWDEWIVDDLDD